ncbi:MAG: hypothetical protein IJH79_14075, partial [Lentisphaeria bacterium]|nr:hypothetical protein [Lentisphaeria bacterium]
MNRLKPCFVYPGPMSDFSLHNHSRWSDGKSDMESMCRAARSAGIRVFGLSDHYVLHPEPAMMP